MTRFLLIRHATNHTVGKRFAGRMQGVHLNDEGKAQAQHLAERLSSLPIAAVYSSPLERAVETAEPLAGVLNQQTITSDDFLELELGEWTNTAFEDLAGEPQFRLFNSFRSCTRIPGGELMLEAQARIITGLGKLVARHPGQTVAVVSHADLIKAAVAYYAGIHLDLFQRIEISPASVSVVELYEDTARILLLNHTGDIRF
jgi:probable phosphomutase (TIGR03848 family)